MSAVGNTAAFSLFKPAASLCKGSRVEGALSNMWVWCKCSPHNSYASSICKLSAGVKLFDHWNFNRCSSRVFTIKAATAMWLKWLTCKNAADPRTGSVDFMGSSFSGMHSQMCFLGDFMWDCSLNWSLLCFLRLISCLVSPTRRSFMWLLFENRLGVRRAWEKSNLKAVRGFRPH